MRLTEIVRRLLLPMVLSFALAVPIHAACEHDYVEIRQEPDCENDGFTCLECRFCGHTTNFDPLPSPGHTFGEWYILKEPTCSREGLQAQDCIVCGHQRTAPTPNRGHNYGAEVKHPTCTAGGYTRYTCRACSSYYIADYTDLLGHLYDGCILLKEPSETDRGRVRFTCLRCSDPHLVYYSFLDIDADAYYFTPVLLAVDRAITDGVDDRHFDPDGLCSRAQAVTFLWRAAGKPEPVSAVNPFLDVPAGSFYEKAVLWAFESGITTGTSECHFSPDAPCSRAQVVTFLHRLHGCPEPTMTTVFSDVREDSFYHQAVQWAAQQEITLGMDGGRFCPEQSCSRAQIVTFLYRDSMNP